MLREQKPIDTMLAISHHFENKHIENTKKYLQDNYGSTLSHGSHITIVDSPQSESNLGKLLSELENFLKNISPFTIPIGKIIVDGRNNFFNIPIRSKELKKFHFDLQKIVNKYRENAVRLKDVNRIKENPNYYSPLQLEMIDKFGYPYAGEHFYPHISIGTAKDAGTQELKDIELKLTNILGTILNSELPINTIDVVFFKDSENQTQQKEYWRKRYVLN